MKTCFRLFLVSFILFLNSCEDEPSVVTPEFGTLTDVEGNVYRTVKIGDQWWMAENLAVSTFNNGDAILYVTSTDSIGWAGSTNSVPLCCYYEGNSNAPGMLYNFKAVSDSRQLAPAGWHVASDEDWKTLEQFVGMSGTDASKTGWRGSNQGDQLKKTGLDYWARYQQVWATDAYSFSALAGGCRLFDARYSTPGGLTYAGFWWTSTPQQGVESWYRYLDYKASAVFRSHVSAGYGMSVRCVKD